MLQDERLVKLGRILRSKRERLGWTIYNMGDAINRDPTVVSKGETATVPFSVDNLREYARVLGTAALFLLIEAGFSSEAEYWYCKKGSRKGLKPKGEKQQSEVFAPRNIPQWSAMLEDAQLSHRDGELKSSRRIATRLLEQIDSVIEYSDEIIHQDEQEEAIRLWLEGWFILSWDFESLLAREELKREAAPYVQRAEKLVERVTDPALQALADYVKADIYHVLNDHNNAVAYSEKVVKELPVKRHPLTPLAQRLIMIDGCFVRPLDTGMQLRIGQDMLDSVQDNFWVTHLLLEGIGRVLALKKNPECWNTLELLEHKGKMNSPHLFMKALRDQMIACVSFHPVDQDKLCQLGERGLEFARPRGWGKYTEQIKELAEEGGIKMEVDKDGRVYYTKVG